MPHSTSPGPYVDRGWTPVAVDPITLRVMGGALVSIAREMAQVLYRMAYSSVIRESEDLGAGLFDPEGREFCESDSTPMHIGSLPAYIRGVNRKLRGQYQPGDVILHNHPYYGASHSPDYGVLIPMFWEGCHIGFAGCTGHLLDVGGATPGISIEAFDVFAEGKLLDAVRLEAAGVRNQELFEHIVGNVRTPDMNAGDLEAMISCCRLGERRFAELLGHYGHDVVMSGIETWMERSEQRLRAAIAEIPDGVYAAPTGYLDDDGRNRGQPLAIGTTVTIQGSELTVDLTGSAPEAATAVNCPFEGSVLPTANFAVRTLLLDEALSDDFIPQNDGIFRPVHVTAPLGTIYNPRFPRACSGRFPLINRIPDQINLALSEVLPRQITAGNSASVQGVAYAGFDGEADQYWLYMEIGEGSYGARHGKDGLDSIDNLMANTRNNPIEEIEMRLPIRCERYELRDHPPAPGRWRGGLGSIRRWRFLADATVGANGDSRLDRPRGVFGGHDGWSGALVKNEGRPDREDLHAKFSGLPFLAGDTITVEVPSGAGYGDPRQRDPDAVRRDVLDGYYTVKQAEEFFGVVIRLDGEAASRRAKEPEPARGLGAAQPSGE
ncbi:hydantoinase B/oxoprolinase family protein [bacterium]|nr:MAG: hydantoinase B/oxoprolinase family protein [bacterium]